MEFRRLLFRSPVEKHDQGKNPMQCRVDPGIVQIDVDIGQEHGVDDPGDHHVQRHRPSDRLPRLRLWISNCRSEEHTSELQSLMRISYAVFCLKKKTKKTNHEQTSNRPKT